MCSVFFFNDTATTEIYTLSLHDALPIYLGRRRLPRPASCATVRRQLLRGRAAPLRCCGRGGNLLGEQQPRQGCDRGARERRSEEHTSELQSRQYLVCRLLLEKKKKKIIS